VRSPRSPSNFSASTSHAGTPCSARVSPATGCTSSFRDRSKSASVRRTARRICSPSWTSDMFGEMSVFDPGPRTSTATTITEVRAVSKDRDALRGHGSPIATKSPSSCCGSWPAGCAAPTATWTPLVVGAARVSFVRAAPGPGVIPPGGSGEGRATDVVHHPRRWPRTISFADGGHQRLVDVRGPSRQHGDRMRSPQTCSGDIDVVVARRHRSRLALPLRPVTSGPTTVAFLGGDLMNVPGRPGRSTRRP